MSRKVPVTLTNRMAVFTGPVPRLGAYWSFARPNYHFIARRYPYISPRISLLRNGVMPAGLFWATAEKIEKETDYEFIVTQELIPLRRSRTKPILSTGKYEWQNECADAMVDAGERGGGLIVNATGSGKTRIAAMFASRVKCPLLFVVDQLDLLEQAKDEIEEWTHEDVGYVGKSIFEPQRITVATIQTMHKHRDKRYFREWTDKLADGVVIIDEIHVQMARRNFDVVERIEPIAVYGLTATLQLNHKDVALRAYAISGPVIYRYGLQKGQESGVLSEGICASLKYTNVSYSKKRSGMRLEANTRKGNASLAVHPIPYQDNYRRKITENAERNALLEFLVRELRNRKYYTILLLNRVAHLKEMSHRLSDIPHRIVYGEKKVEERRGAVSKFEQGKVRVILSNRVFKKGINIKRLDAIIDGAAMKSQNDAQQKYGRGVRLHEHKLGLMYFDISDYDPNAIHTDAYNKQIDKFNKRMKSKVIRALTKRKMKKDPFHVATKSRLKALKNIGVPILKIQWESAESAVTQAENFLRTNLDLAGDRGRGEKGR
jgi:superfamily II DNA or RNA helicase